MSMFSLPSDLGPDEMTKAYASMTDWMNADSDNMLPFLAQSAGAAAVASSLGLSVASHMTGSMLGLLEGMMSVSMRTAEIEKAGVSIAPETAGSVTAKKARAEKTAEKKSGAASNVVPIAKEAASETVEAPVAKKAKPAKATGRKAPSGKQVSADKQMSAVEQIKVSADQAAQAALESAGQATGEAEGPVSQLEPEDFRRPTEVEKPATPDDLKLISGIGPKLEQVLNGLGIWTFAQIAAWTPNEIAWVDDYLQFKGRIERDDWMAQAAALAAGGREEYERVFGKEPR